MSIQQAIKEALVDKSRIIYTGSKDLSDTIVIHSGYES